MQTMMLTTAEFEQAARQWAVDFLHERWDAVRVVTDLRRLQGVSCEGRNLILFERAPPEVLRHALQHGGHPWLVSSLVTRAGRFGHYSL